MEVNQRSEMSVEQMVTQEEGEVFYRQGRIQVKRELGSGYLSGVS